MAETQYEDRTDSVAEKLRLLQRAYEQGNRDLALSLAESIRDTLHYERQRQRRPQEPASGAQHALPVQDLPPSWRAWAEGWGHCKVLEVSETAGMDRVGEPVDVEVAFAGARTTDLQREVRVARIDARQGTLHRVVSQVYGEVFEQGERRCRLVFQADVGAGNRAHYLVFYDNPFAELPGYTSDLRVRGEGYGLDIENHHFVARLSQQMGQLERLTYKRDHGLELFAGGEGHGEPPHIDWAHDYASGDHFQKFRVTNWARCPNWEVVRGPLCVRVRRWGFPHSPGHPLFAPSRLHVDVTYAFYAGQPYFVKEGRMDMLKDFEGIVRDDEWVFSGYSFTHLVWMGRDGSLHEVEIPPPGQGASGVPEEHREDLWAVGFVNKSSRDAFIALRLEHRAENYEALVQTGVPFDYRGHGLVWARYPAKDRKFREGAALVQRNAYLVQPYEDPAEVEALHRLLRAPLQVRAAAPPTASAAPARGRLARPGETEQGAPLKKAIWEALLEVEDEMFYNADANVVDMGYIYDLRVEEDVVHVLLTMPHKGRPRYGFITRPGPTPSTPLRDRLLKIDGVREVVVDFTWEPAWSASRMTERGRRALGLEL